MKVVFMGTPDFAVSSLEALLGSSHSVVGVVTQPDRAIKHGKTECCAVKSFCIKQGIEVFQPEKIREHVNVLKQYGADIAVTAAYGQILNADVINAFPLGIVNVHASLLPEYRGASPIQSAIADGKTVTGVTIMKTEIGIDTGDILSARKVEIKKYETAGELTARLSVVGAELLVETLDNFNSVVPVKQDESAATHCRMISKSEQYIDFEADCINVVNKIRSLSPQPCAKTIIEGEIYKIYEAVPCKCNAPAGTVTECKKRLIIACGTGGIEVRVIQAPSKRALCVSDFLNGKKFDVGVKCAKP